MKVRKFQEEIFLKRCITNGMFDLKFWYSIHSTYYLLY